MRRVPLAIASVVVLASAPEPVARACSYVVTPHMDEATGHAPDALFRMWGPARGEFEVALLDEAGRSVPVSVVADLLPPGYDGRDQYTRLRALVPLAPGRYTVKLLEPDNHPSVRTEWTFGVSGGPTGGARPGPVRGLRARVVRETCATPCDSHPCAFVVLEFEDPFGGAHPVYYARWWRRPPQPFQLRFPGMRDADGFRGERVGKRTRVKLPISWFGGLFPTDLGVAIQIGRTADDGWGGPTAETSVAAAEVRAAAGPDATAAGPPHEREEPIAKRYVTDVERFRRAADPLSAATLALLVGAPVQEGDLPDRAFRAALRDKHRVHVRGRLRGHEDRVTVTLKVGVSGGRVSAPLCPVELRALLDTVPLESPDVERVDVTYGGRNDSEIEVLLRGGEPIGGSWQPDDPWDIREDVRNRHAYWARIEAMPLYGELMRTNGAPVTRQYGESHFRGPGASDILIVEIPGGDAPVIRLRGALAHARTASLAPVLDAVLASFGPGLDDSTFSIDARLTGDAIEGQISGQTKQARFAGRLGSPDVRLVDR
jgi:hypothetical protein